MKLKSSLGQYSKQYNNLTPNQSAARAPANNGVLGRRADAGVLGDVPVAGSSGLLDTIARAENVYQKDPYMAWGGLLGSVLGNEYELRGERKNKKFVDARLNGEEVSDRKSGYQTKPKNGSKVTDSIQSGADVNGVGMTPSPMEEAGQALTMSQQIAKAVARNGYNHMFSDPENENPLSVKKDVRNAENTLAAIPNVFNANTDQMLKEIETQLRSDGVWGAQLERTMDYARGRIAQRKAQDSPGVLQTAIPQIQDWLAKGDYTKARTEAFKLYTQGVLGADMLMNFVSNEESVALQRQEEANLQNRFMLQQQQEAALAREKMALEKKIHGVKDGETEKIDYLLAPQYYSAGQMKIYNKIADEVAEKGLKFVESLHEDDKTIVDKALKAVASGGLMPRGGILGKLESVYKYKNNPEDTERFVRDWMMQFDKEENPTTAQQEYTNFNNYLSTLGNKADAVRKMADVLAVNKNFENFEGYVNKKTGNTKTTKTPTTVDDSESPEIQKLNAEIEKLRKEAVAAYDDPKKVTPIWKKIHELNRRIDTIRAQGRLDTDIGDDEEQKPKNR